LPSTSAAAGAAAVVLLLTGGLNTATAAAAGSTSATLYVDAALCNGTGDYTGTGTAAQPFCTISQAAAQVLPGQTVQVAPGNYDETVDLTHSGTPSAPITFLADTTDGTSVQVGPSGAQSGSGLTLSGATDVVVRGFNAHSDDAPGTAAISVVNSSNITLDRDTVQNGGTGVEVSGASSHVTISRSRFTSSTAPGVQVDPGVTGTQVTDDDVLEAADPDHPAPSDITVNDAPQTVVTGNTLANDCAPAIDLQGASTGSTLDNNIIETAAQGLDTNLNCPATDQADQTGITVAPDSAPQTLSDYNLISPQGETPYTWAGTAYSTPAALTTATGQGSHDLLADPQILWNGATSPNPQAIDTFTLTATSPAIDSADADAPGELPTDILGYPREDDPAVPNTATGYDDRGAAELQGPLKTAGGAFSVTPNGPADPLGVTVSLTPPQPQWTANGPLLPAQDISYEVDNDPFPIPLTNPDQDYTFARAGLHTVHEASERGGGTSDQVVLGAGYTPVTPLRLLDTRYAIGTPTTTAVPPGGTITLPLTAITGIPAADISAVTANVTVTGATTDGSLTVYPQGTPAPTSSNLNFTQGQTIANLVTSSLGTGGLVFHNSSHGPVQVIADLQGYYSATGLPFKATAPTRLLDTRSGLGTPTHTAAPIPAHGTLTLDLAGKLPTGTTAAVLNLTATAPTRNGFITAYPYGTKLPTTSNLDFTTGQTIPNLVTVPVLDGKVELYNGGSGTVHLIADLEGYYGPTSTGATTTYLPDGPVRIADTRNGTGNVPAHAIPAHGSLTVYPTTLTADGTTATETSALLNITVTDPQHSGVLTVYTTGQPRPTTSNLNFTTGQTIPNLVSIADPTGGITIYNDSTGTVQLIVDQEGYYLTQHP